MLIGSIAGCGRTTPEPTAEAAVEKEAVDLGTQVDPADAIRQCTQAIEADPKNVVAIRDRADLYFKTGHYDKAVADYTKALALKPDSRTYYNRGVAYSAQNM